MARPTSDYAAAEATPHLLAALEALAAGDRAGHNLELVRAAGLVGWSTLVDRLDTAVRALLFDARLDALDERTIVRMLPEVASVVPAVDPDELCGLPDLLRALALAEDTGDAPALESARTRLLLVAFLIDRLGYPPAVLA